MESFWWSPRILFIKGAFLLLLLLVYQLFKKPFLSDFDISSGELKKYEMKRSRGMENKRILYLWLNDTISQPFTTEYKEPQKNINTNIGFIEKYGLTIWHDKRREIKQLQSNKTLIVDYDWFWWPSLLFYLYSLAIHFGMFLLVKKDSININSYADMWSYTIGEREIIEKHNYRKYERGGILPFMLYNPMFRSKKNRESIYEAEITFWRQFFNICNARAMKPAVREWMEQTPKGRAFLQGYDFYEKLIRSEIPPWKLTRTTDSIFEFISLRLDFGREHYEDFGRLFREEFPREYFKMLKELDKIR
ncbi:hypothetical protein SAMN04488513_102691 [Pseudozobellia thermophila]|uniref:Uncharacterized protein n=2 Tax=Pseudozobellia thermophila TaxID=192903 RepID=A0A1M6G6D0_9FLAO|nr:hypothetical protein SAMN04488513_102691 [Pseudozobellia thermophila]